MFLAIFLGVLTIGCAVGISLMLIDESKKD